jgi:iron complex outermembrane receptor protein
MTTLSRSLGSSLALVLAAALSMVPPRAEPASEARPSTVIEEVVVIARKREESLQTVPLAVTTYTGEQLEAQGIRTPIDLGRSVPSLRSLGHPASASIVTFTLRGQSAGDVLSTVDQAVGLYVDGVYIARPRGLNAAFFDLERVEVLKGPQGTLYGRNTTGGAINLISRNADYDGLHGYAQGQGGDYDEWKLGGAINVPIVAESVAMRLAYQRWRRGGFGESSVTGQRIGQDRDQHFFRGSLVVDPKEGFNVVLKGEYYRSRENGNINIPRFVEPTALAIFEAAVETGSLTPEGLGRLFAGQPTLEDLAAFGAGAAALGALTAQGADDWRTTHYETPQHDWFESYTVGATVTMDLTDNMQLQSITGYREFENRQVFDLDGTPFRILEVGVGQFPDNPVVLGLPSQPAAPFQTDGGPEQDADFLSQEFTMSGTALNQRLHWLGGVYYSHEEGSDTQHAQAFPAVLPNTFLHDGASFENVSWSMYTQNDVHLTKTLALTVGGRWTEERRSLRSHSRNFFYDTGTITCLTGVPGTFDASNEEACETEQEETFTGFSYLASLNWQATPDTLVYLKTARGFRGGAFQLRSPTLAPAEPEKARDIEIGVKSDCPDRRLRVNAAAYHTKYSNKQESIIVTQPDGNPATMIQNAADAELNGFELEVFARPTDRLTLTATAAYLDGEYDSFPAALPVDATTPEDASGERFANPPWTYSLSGRYEFPVSAGILALQADWAWTDGARPPDRLVADALPDDLVDSFVSACTEGSCSNGRNDLGTLNLRADYELLEWDATVSFFMTNALDRVYQVSGVGSSNIGGLQTGITGEPRMWGLVLRKSLGPE